MTFTRSILADIEKCYAVCGAEIGGEPCLFFAGEGNGSVRAFRGPGFRREDLIWEGGGGTMSIVPLGLDSLLVSRGFYSMVDAGGSTIEVVRYQDGAFTHEPVASLPYLHRFGILAAPDGRRCVLAATIADHKENKDDWSKPGHLYGAELPEDTDRAFTLSFRRLPGDYHMNHGFCTARQQGRETAFTACREGVFAVTPPAARGESWEIAQLMDWPVSDVAVCDVDGDGENEIAAILPFHGNRFIVYRRGENGYGAMYEHPAENDFYHVVISAVLGGEPAFIGGARQLRASLFALRQKPEGAGLEAIELDHGEGSSNAFLYHAQGRDLLLSANRMRGQAAVYAFD